LNFSAAAKILFLVSCGIEFAAGALFKTSESDVGDKSRCAANSRKLIRRAFTRSSVWASGASAIEFLLGLRGIGEVSHRKEREIKKSREFKRTKKNGKRISPERKNILTSIIL
jgi:hypothetical protein